MHNKRSIKKEIIDDLDFSSPLLLENLKDMECLNRWLGFNRSLIKGIHKIYKRHPSYRSKDRLIADFGCGSGDGLRHIHDWASKNKINCSLIGLDGNEVVLKYAIAQSAFYPEIKYKLQDIINSESIPCYDIVILNHVCHHLDNHTLIDLLNNLKTKTRLAIIINDLHRHWLAYIGIKLISTVFNLCSVTKYDGPLSVLRAFRKMDLITIFKQSNIHSFSLRWIWPFRWQAILWCAGNNVENSSGNGI